MSKLFLSATVHWSENCCNPYSNSVEAKSSFIRNLKSEVPLIEKMIVVSTKDVIEKVVIDFSRQRD